MAQLTIIKVSLVGIILSVLSELGIDVPATDNKPFALPDGNIMIGGCSLINRSTVIQLVDMIVLKGTSLNAYIEVDFGADRVHLTLDGKVFSIEFKNWS